MTVSIVIPVHNQAGFVAEAIRSAIGQTWEDTEVIVVDDGSTDGSYQVAWNFLPKVTLIGQGNKRQAAARNCGFREASGELLLPLDADDVLDPSYLERTVPLMTDGVGIVATDMQYFGSQSNRIAPLGVLIDIEKSSNELPVTSLICREAFEQVGGYCEDLEVHGMEDWDLWLKILERGWRVAILNEPLFRYRVGHTSTCGEVAGRRDDIVRAVKARHPGLYR